MVRFCCSVFKELFAQKNFVFSGTPKGLFTKIYRRAFVQRTLIILTDYFRIVKHFFRFFSSFKSAFFRDFHRRTKVLVCPFRPPAFLRSALVIILAFRPFVNGFLRIFVIFYQQMLKNVILLRKNPLPNIKMQMKNAGIKPAPHLKSFTGQQLRPRYSFQLHFL